MDDVWSTALYGGDTLPDARLDGADDYSGGVVFRDMANARVLFLTQSCLREEQGTCFNGSSRFYEATHNGLDAMVRRYMQEAALLAQDDLADVAPVSSRCAQGQPLCLWAPTRSRRPALQRNVPRETASSDLAWLAAQCSPSPCPR